jgi:hypothetical protein
MEIARVQTSPFAFLVRALGGAQVAMSSVLSQAQDWVNTIVKVRSRNQRILIGFTLAPIHFEAPS